MALENPTYIDGLVPEWPLQTDKGKEGDDHLRIIKQALQNTFPQFNSALKITSDGLNALTDHFSYVAASEDGTWLERMEAHNLDWTSSIPIAAATPTAAQYAINPNMVITYTAVMNMFYPVGRVIISEDQRNPAEYLGFGTWDARYGYVAAVGAMTDAGGCTATLVLGYNSGWMRVHPSHIVAHAPYFDLNTDWEPEHQHQMGTSFSSDGSFSGGGESAFGPGGDMTSWAGAHDHDVMGTITVGQGDAVSGTPFTPPATGFYVWARVA